METFLVYGFEYDNKIWYNDNLILCKSIKTGNPVYCSIMVKNPICENNIEIIEELQNKNPEKIIKLDKMAKLKYCSPKWQHVYYSENLKFNCGYESEGDENGDPR